MEMLPRRSATLAIGTGGAEPRRHPGSYGVILGGESKLLCFVFCRVGPVGDGSQERLGCRKVVEGQLSDT